MNAKVGLLVSHVAIAAPVVGGEQAPFPPDAMTPWVGKPVQVQGLDPNLTHVLHDVWFTPDRLSGTLLIHTELDHDAIPLDQVTLSASTPPAMVRVQEAGETVFEGPLDRVPTPGEKVRLPDGTRARVTSHATHPNRHPEAGAVQPDPQTGQYPTDWAVFSVVREPSGVNPAHDGAKQP